MALEIGGQIRRPMEEGFVSQMRQSKGWMGDHRQQVAILTNMERDNFCKGEVYTKHQISSLFSGEDSLLERHMDRGDSIGKAIPISV